MARFKMVLWCTYFAAYALLFCITAVNFVREGFFESFFGTFLSWAVLSSDAVAILGVYAYLRSIPSLNRTFWRALLMFMLVRLTISASFFASTLLTWQLDSAHYEALTNLFSLLFSVPMLVALWRYAFGSPSLWRNTNSGFCAGLA
ncbi:MAG: hypothetical protein K0Q60_3986 [Microvirga sp.]|nr:hypothetical protein [Microvirga sp.]